MLRAVRIPAALAVLAIAGGPLSAQDAVDGVTAQCLYYDNGAEICACATEALAGEIAAEDYAIYAEVGAAAMAAIAEGAGLIDAYDAAMAAVGQARGIGMTAVNAANTRAAVAHSSAIEACGLQR